MNRNATGDQPRNGFEDPRRFDGITSPVRRDYLLREIFFLFPFSPYLFVPLSVARGFRLRPSGFFEDSQWLSRERFFVFREIDLRNVRVQKESQLRSTLRFTFICTYCAFIRGISSIGGALWLAVCRKHDWTSAIVDVLCHVRERVARARRTHYY